MQCLDAAWILSNIDDAKQRLANISSSIKQTITHNNNYSFTLHAPESKFDITYKPEPTPLLFHADNSLVRLLMGAYGSGKTSACVAEIIMRAAAMPTCYDDVRHCRVVIIRNTYAELETTTLNSWDNWTSNCFETVERHKKPLIEMTQRFRDEKGIVEVELIFLALDRPEDLKKLKSLEVTFAFVNEACEIPFSLISHLIGRTGRYPSEQMIGKQTYWRGVFMDTNAPDTDHPIYQVFEVERPDGYRIFKQPPALIFDNGKYIPNPAAENISHHQSGYDYYLDMIKGATQEFINVFVMGKYGLVMTGKPVYPSYNDDVHSIDSLEVIPGIPVKIAWDFGLTPACLISQRHLGQIRMIKEFTTDRMGIRELAETIVLPYLRTTFPNYVIESIGDPAGNKGNDNDETSCMQVLASLGLITRGALSNAIVPRIEAVNFYLNRLDNGKPAYIISRSGCPNLRKGFLGKYGYKRVQVLNEEKYRDIPDKSHPFSDIHDCNQYICLDYHGGLDKMEKKEFNAREWLTS